MWRHLNWIRRQFVNTRKNSIRNWLRKCGILTLTAGMILTGMITKPVETYAVTFVQDTDGTKYAVDKKSGFYFVPPNKNHVFAEKAEYG